MNNTNNQLYRTLAFTFRDISITSSIVCILVNDKSSILGVTALSSAVISSLLAVIFFVKFSKD